MEYFSAIKRNEIESVEVMQINIEHVIQNEGQKEKNEFCILRHIYIHTYMKSRKMVLMCLFAGKEWRCRYREQTRRHSRGRRG